MNVRRAIVTLALVSAAMVVALYFLRSTVGPPIDPDAPGQSVSQAPD